MNTLLPRDMIGTIIQCVPETEWGCIMQVCSLWYNLVPKCIRMIDDPSFALDNGQIYSIRQYVINDPYTIYNMFSLTIMRPYIGLTRMIYNITDITDHVRTMRDDLVAIQCIGPKCPFNTFTINFEKVAGVDAWMICSTLSSSHTCRQIVSSKRCPDMDTLISDLARDDMDIDDVRGRFLYYIAHHSASDCARTVHNLRSMLTEGEMSRVLRGIPVRLMAYIKLWEKQYDAQKVSLQNMLESLN